MGEVLARTDCNHDLFKQTGQVGSDYSYRCGCMSPSVDVSQCEWMSNPFSITTYLIQVPTPASWVDHFSWICGLLGSCARVAVVCGLSAFCAVQCCSPRSC